jgi:hypothetical protein
MGHVAGWWRVGAGVVWYGGHGRWCRSSSHAMTIHASWDSECPVLCPQKRRIVVRPWHFIHNIYSDPTVRPSHLYVHTHSSCRVIETVTLRMMTALVLVLGVNYRLCSFLLSQCLLPSTTVPFLVKHMTSALLHRWSQSPIAQSTTALYGTLLFWLLSQYSAVHTFTTWKVERVQSGQGFSQLQT